MTRSEQFVMVVQTEAIVLDIQDGRRLASQVVYLAMGIPHIKIKMNFIDQAREFVGWNYGKCEKPDWYGV